MSDLIGSRSPLANNAQIGSEPLRETTTNAESGTTLDSSGGGNDSDGSWAAIDSPARKNRTTLDPSESAKSKCESGRYLTDPAASTLISLVRTTTSTIDPFNCHPVSKVLADSDAERMFLSLLNKYGEPRAVSIARTCGWDVSRFYPES